MCLLPEIAAPKDQIDRASRKSAYILTREHTHEALRKIESVQWCWEKLFGQAGDRGHYGRYQLRFAHGAWHCGNQKHIRFVTDGQESVGYLRLVTAKTWYAKKLYELALANTSERYPRWADYAYVDGRRAGERVLEFLSEEHELSWAHLWNSLSQHDHPPITEEIFSEPCSDWGDPLPIAQSRLFGSSFSKGYRLFTVVLNKETLGNDEWEQARYLLEAGKPLPLSEKPLEFAFDDIRECIVELSSPEICVLNWADACPALSEQDKQYLAAIDMADPAKALGAISRGANPNAVEPGKNYPLDRLIESWGDLRFQADHATSITAKQGVPSPDNVLTRDEIAAFVTRLIEHGAHPDLFVPDRSPAIVSASLGCHYELVKALIEAGAQVSTDWASDSHPSDWPQAWDSPYFDAFYEHDKDARAIYDLLLLNRPSPILDKVRATEAIVEARKSLAAWLAETCPNPDPGENN